MARVFWGFVLLVGLPAWPQVASPVQSAPAATSDDQMPTPPRVSGAAFPTAVAGETRSNYFRFSLNYQTAYIDNLYGGIGGQAIGEKTFSILPTFVLDQTTPRQHRLFSYSPGFMFYQPTSSLNELNQNALVQYQFRLTPHSSISLNDVFVDSSTSFLSSNSGVGGTVSGSAQFATPQVIPPFAQQLSNQANAVFTLQPGLNTMFGASGMATLLRYPNPSEASGLYNSSARGGSAFYNRRLTESQFIGGTYEYSDFLSYPPNATSETQTHTVSAFYTLYVKRQLSISLSGGPQRYEVSEPPFPSSKAWQPTVMASVGWQGMRTSFAVSYLREVTGGGGLLGAYKTSSSNLSGRWQISRNWAAGVGGAYANYVNVSPALLTAGTGGHFVSGNATLDHTFAGQLQVGLQYDRVHQSYGGIASLAANPNSNRVAGSISWQFMRAIGR